MSKISITRRVAQRGAVLGATSLVALGTAAAAIAAPAVNPSSDHTSAAQPQFCAALNAPHLADLISLPNCK